MTDFPSIVEELKQELDRVNAAIKILEGAVAGDGRRKGSAPRRGPRRLSAAARRRISAIAKARWTKAKKAGRNSL
jgi:hypothetical protein